MFFRFCYSSSFVVEHVCVFVVVLLLKNFGGKSRTKSHILWIEICLFPSLLGRNKGFLPSLQLLGPTTFPHFFGLPKKQGATKPDQIFIAPVQPWRTECYVGSLPSSDGADFTDCLSNSEGLPIGAGESCQAEGDGFSPWEPKGTPRMPATPPKK